MHQSIKKPNNQFYIFIAGIILFGLIAALGWVKLQYGFTFMDEGYHMVESWRLSAGDHFIHDTNTGALRNYRLFNKQIFDLWPDITLLEFRKLQFLLTGLALLIFGAALYYQTKQYWYLPFVFSIFAFTGLDPLGATSNLNYYTYPHLFLVLHISFLLFGLRTDNSIIKSIFFILSGSFLWGISLSLLHLSPVIAAPVLLYLCFKFFDFKHLHFRLTDLAIVLAPFFLFWAIFLVKYNLAYIISVLTSLKMLKSIPIYSGGLFHIDWTVLAYTLIMAVFALACLLIINTFKPHKLIYLLLLSILAFGIIDTSLFGLIKPYWKDWYSRPMWFAGLLISFHLFFWLFVFTKRFFLKQALKPRDQLAMVILIPSTVLFAFASTFSGFGAILMLHCAIPTVAVITILIINHEKIKIYSNILKLIILIVISAPFYYTTAWSDWNFTYCDVKPKDADVEITEGFLEGIQTNSLYKMLHNWIRKNTVLYSKNNDFIISYTLTPMVYMIAERRPAIEESFLAPPLDWYVKNYRTELEKMKQRNRFPAIVFVFDNSPALNILSKKTRQHNLKGEVYNLYSIWYKFEKSDDPMAEYIRNNMVMVDSITYYNHMAMCFVDKKIYSKKQSFLE